MKVNDIQLLGYFILWLLFPFMVAFSFMEIFIYGKTYLVILATKIFANIKFPLLQSNNFNRHVCFGMFCLTITTEFPSLILRENITSKTCGT